jgi:hypothetical protein
LWSNKYKTVLNPPCELHCCVSLTHRYNGTYEMFFLFSLWEKQLKPTFLPGKESTFQERNLVFLLDNSMPINLNLCSFHQQRHNIIHLQNLSQ